MQSFDENNRLMREILLAKGESIEEEMHSMVSEGAKTVITSRFEPHQGQKEIQRRLRQIEKGMLKIDE